MADKLLVLVPHEHTHAPRSILEKARKLGPDLTEMGAIKHRRRRVVHATGSQERLNERPDWTRSQSGLSNQQEVTSETIKVRT